MNGKKSVTLTGVAIAIAAGAGSHLAMAGIDKGGKAEPQPKVSRGSVSRFGSVFVNGVRFNTDNAVFIIDGRFGSESDLEVGQIVSVYGSVDDFGDTGTASLVTYEDAVEGPISQIDTASNRMTVLGQTVLVNGDTAFATGDGADSLSSLNQDQVVEVSGHVDADGNIVATYVGNSAATGSYDVQGVITNLDSLNQTLEINGLDVDYSGANLYALPFGELQVGQQLEVVGTETNVDSLEANHIWAVETGLGGQSGALGEVEGLLTSWLSLGKFVVDGVNVRLRWGTRFENGSLFNLSLNRKIEVEGSFDATGTLVADTIEFEPASDFEHSGYVQSVYENMIIVDGVAMTVTNETAFEDDSDADERRFNVENLRSGDFVTVRGYASNNDIVATRLERDDDGQDDDEEYDDD